MGAAKRRGTLEQRIAQAKARSSGVVETLKGHAPTSAVELKPVFTVGRGHQRAALIAGLLAMSAIPPRGRR